MSTLVLSCDNDLVRMSHSCHQTGGAAKIQGEVRSIKVRLVNLLVRTFSEFSSEFFSDVFRTQVDKGEAGEPFGGNFFQSSFQIFFRAQVDKGEADKHFGKNVQNMITVEMVR